MTTLLEGSRTERFNALVLARPVGVALIFFFAVFVLRLIDLFILRLDQLPDEMIVSRVLGILIMLGYLWVLRKPILSTGLHTRNFGKAFLIGGLSLLLLDAVLYAVQFSLLRSTGESPQLFFAAIDPATGAYGGLFFTLFLLFGQLANALMEETIFRGIVLPHLMRRFRFWQANVLQAILFGLAHLVFPLSSWASGRMTAEGALGEAALLMLSTIVGGLVFGYLYYRTGSLWTAVFAHLIDNSVWLLFHIMIASSLSAETGVFMLARAGFLLLPVLAWAVARRAKLPRVMPWGTV